jgi:hypothetical protein
MKRDATWHNMTSVGSKALQRSLTREYIEDGFKKAGIWPLDKSVMEPNIIGDMPSASFDVVAVKSKLNITLATMAQIDGLNIDIDALNVLNTNYSIMQDKITRSKAPKIEGTRINGGLVMTQAEIIAEIATKEARMSAKRDEVAAKKALAVVTRAARQEKKIRDALLRETKAETKRRNTEIKCEEKERKKSIAKNKREAKEASKSAAVFVGADLSCVEIVEL